MTDTATTNEQSKVEQVTDKTTEVAGAVKEQALSVASTARDEVSNVVGDAKQQARRLVDDSRQQLRATANEQAGRLSQTLRDIGEQLTHMASSASGGNQTVTDVTRQAGSTVSHFADELDRRGIEGVTSEVKRFARQRPGLFIAGALGAGVVVGRLLRTVDTGAIVDAAKPSGDTNGTSDGNGTAAAPALQLPQTQQSIPAVPASPGGAVPAPQSPPRPGGF